MIDVRWPKILSAFDRLNAYRRQQPSYAITASGPAYKEFEFGQSCSWFIVTTSASSPPVGSVRHSHCRNTAAAALNRFLSGLVHFGTQSETIPILTESSLFTGGNTFSHKSRTSCVSSFPKYLVQMYVLNHYVGPYNRAIMPLKMMMKIMLSNYTRNLAWLLQRTAE